MRDYLELGPSPVEEDCLQMGVASNKECKAECERFQRLLERVIPIPDRLPNVKYGVKFFPYEGPAGGYYEVVIYFDGNNEQECEFVLGSVEANVPQTWDDVE